jgi:uncharacterized protein YjbI with pentapeptide repeats
VAKRTTIATADSGVREPVKPRLPKTLAPAELPRDDLRDDAELVALAYDGVDLSAREVDAADMERCRCTSTRFTQGVHGRVSLSDCVLDGCDLANSRVRDSSLLRVLVTSSRLTGLSWTDGSFKDVRWESCRADLASFRFSTFKAVLFHDCNLRQASFQEADLRGAVFENCDLTGAQFSNANMAGARFSGSTLLDVSGVQSMRGAVVAGRDVTDLAYSLASSLGIIIDD